MFALPKQKCVFNGELLVTNIPKPSISKRKPVPWDKGLGQKNRLVRARYILFSDVAANKVRTTKATQSTMQIVTKSPFSVKGNAVPQSRFKCGMDKTCRPLVGLTVDGRRPDPC